LPCHHIIRFHLERQTEIPAEAFLHHWRNRCLEDDAILTPSVTSPTKVQTYKRLRMPKMEREQFNMALDLFRKMANTLSSFTKSDFQDKLQLFIKIRP
ncbi:Uncharacterized protein APZ42_001539, partial [Daphnia magna]